MSFRIQMGMALMIHQMPYRWTRPKPWTLIWMVWAITLMPTTMVMALRMMRILVHLIETRRLISFGAVKIGEHLDGSKTTLGHVFGFRIEYLDQCRG